MCMNTENSNKWTSQILTIKMSQIKSCSHKRPSLKHDDMQRLSVFEGVGIFDGTADRIQMWWSNEAFRNRNIPWCRSQLPLLYTLVSSSWKLLTHSEITLTFCPFQGPFLTEVCQLALLPVFHSCQRPARGWQNLLSFLKLCSCLIIHYL